MNRALGDQALAAAATSAEFMADMPDPEKRLAEPVRAAGLGQAVAKIAGLEGLVLMDRDGRRVALSPSKRDWDIIVIGTCEGTGIDALARAAAARRILENTADGAGDAALALARSAYGISWLETVRWRRGETDFPTLRLLGAADGDMRERLERLAGLDPEADLTTLLEEMDSLLAPDAVVALVHRSSSTRPVNR